MMFTAFTIADEILRIAKRSNQQLTPMQLMKLVYISHGWSLAIRKRDIISDRIEAWKYGPVIPSLYQATKQFGRKKIPLELIDDSESSVLDEDLKAFLKDVYLKYGHLSGVQLSSLTHKPRTPWSQVSDVDMTNNEISDHCIKAHYVEKFNEYKQSEESWNACAAIFPALQYQKNDWH